MRSFDSQWSFVMVEAVSNSELRREVGICIVHHGSRERFGSFDALRTLMCFGIATYHFVPYFFSKDSSFNQYTRFFSYFTDMFFVFSGIFMARASARKWSLATYREFLVTRMARIYPLHIVTLLFYLVIAAGAWAGILKPENSDRYAIDALLPQLTLTQAWGFGPALAFDYPNWALSAVFACYLAAPALSWICRQRAWVSVITLLTLIAAGASVASNIGLELTHLQAKSLGIFRALPSVFFGLMLGRLKLRITSKLVSAAILSSAVFLSFGWGYPLDGPLRLAAIYALITAVLLAERAGLWTPLQSRWLQMGAKYSFGIYLLHGVIATVLLQVMTPMFTHVTNRQLGHDLPLLALLIIGFALLASWALAWVSLRTVERRGAKVFVAALRSKSHSPPF